MLWVIYCAFLVLPAARLSHPPLGTRRSNANTRKKQRPRKKKKEKKKPPSRCRNFKFERQILRMGSSKDADLLVVAPPATTQQATTTQQAASTPQTATTQQASPRHRYTTALVIALLAAAVAFLGIFRTDISSWTAIFSPAQRIPRPIHFPIHPM